MTDNTFKPHTFVLKEDGIYTDDGIKVNDQGKMLHITWYYYTGGFKRIDEWKRDAVGNSFTLNCMVEIKQQEVPCPDGIKGCMVLHSRAVALVTFPEDKPEPEAAGQEQETAEVFLKAMKPQVADFDKHDKVAKVFDYYDMTGFAAQYASQQTASLQKQIAELRKENERLKENSNK